MGGAHGWRSGKSRWEPVPGGPFDVGAQLRVAATVSASGDNPHVATRPAAARLTYRRARARSSRPTVVRPADGLGTRRPRDPDRPLVCQDETSKQLLAETRVPIPIKPARPARCDHEPNGTANLFVMLHRSKAGASPIAPAVDPRAGDYQRMATGCLGCQAKLWSLRESNDA